MYRVIYRGNPVRAFLTYDDAVQWLHQIGRPELISSINIIYRPFTNDTPSESEPVLNADGKRN